MNSKIDKASLQKFLHTSFGREINIKSVILDKVPVGRSSAASVFLTDKNQLFVFIASHVALNVGDVRKIMRQMNLVPDEMYPPKNQKGYFEEVSSRKFREVYPGRKEIRESDLAYYKTLVPYSPALISVSEIREGVIKQFDPDAVNGWRNAVKLNYRRIKTI